ncbi:MAG: type II secretion system F family protein [Candidatus Brocadiia bacterium]|nr:type II secretion system F family protein [Planctomycetota bacterium]
MQTVLPGIVFAAFLGDPQVWVIILCVFAAVALLAYSGLSLFGSGWQTYEQRYLEDAERSLDAIYLTIPPQHVVYLSLACFVVVSLLWIWLFGKLLVGILFGLMGLAIPKIILWWLKKRRNKKFDHQLVEALTNLGNSLKAGFSLNQAMNLLAQEMDNPMGQEIRLVVREMQVGADLSEALGHLHDRMPSRDLDLIITSILISREVGGDLTEIFDNIAHTVRERHRIEGKIKAMSAQGKLQGLIILCIPPGMAIALNYIAPDMIKPLFTEPVGWLLMGVVVLLMAMGIYTIRRIVAIEV